MDSIMISEIDELVADNLILMKDGLVRIVSPELFQEVAAIWREYNSFRVA